MLAHGINSANSPVTPHLLLPDQVKDYWPEVAALLYPSVKASSGMTTLEHLRDSIQSGIATCFLFARENRIRLAVVIDAVDYPTYRAARILAIGGNDVDAAMQHMAAIEAWCLGAGCVEIEGWCNDTLVRFWRKRGMRKKVTMMVLDLRRKLQ